MIAINNFSIQRALKRKVAMRIITEESYESNDSRVLQALERFPNFEHRYAITPLEVWLRLYDDKEILLTTATKLQETNSDTVFSNNASLVELAQTYFNALGSPQVYPKIKPLNGIDASLTTYSLTLTVVFLTTK